MLLYAYLHKHTETTMKYVGTIFPSALSFFPLLFAFSNGNLRKSKSSRACVYDTRRFHHSIRARDKRRWQCFVLEYLFSRQVLCSFTCIFFRDDLSSLYIFVSTTFVRSIHRGRSNAIIRPTFLIQIQLESNLRVFLFSLLQRNPLANQQTQLIFLSATK